MRLSSIIFLLFLPIIIMAQEHQDDLRGSKKLRFGLTLQVTPSFWKQNNLNNALSEIDMPKARNISNSLAVGDIIQTNKLRFTLLLIALINGNSTNNTHLTQQFGGIELNGEYFIIKNKKLALSPLIGGGLLYGTSRFRNNRIPDNFPDAFMNGNTTTLFNRQGYLNLAVNLGFDYSPRYQDHIYQISLGYRFGFANTKWSTDPKRESLSDAPSDVLRQVYLALKMNLLFTNK